MPYKSKEDRDRRRRMHYVAHREEEIQANRAYRFVNQEALSVQRKARHAAGGDVAIAKRRDRYHADPEYRARILECNRRWRQRQKEQK